MSNIECIFYIENPDTSHLPINAKLNPILATSTNTPMKSLAYWLEYKEKVRLDFYPSGKFKGQN